MARRLAKSGRTTSQENGLTAFLIVQTVFGEVSRERPKARQGCGLIRLAVRRAVPRVCTFGGPRFATRRQ